MRKSRRHTLGKIKNGFADWLWWVTQFITENQVLGGESVPVFKCGFASNLTRIERLGAEAAQRHQLLRVDLVGDKSPHARLITRADRPNNDRRYATNPTRISREKGWQPRHNFGEGMAATMDYYFANPD